MVVATREEEPEEEEGDEEEEEPSLAFFQSLWGLKWRSFALKRMVLLTHFERGSGDYKTIVVVLWV